jgi:hypothetical protein
MNFLKVIASALNHKETTDYFVNTDHQKPIGIALKKTCICPSFRRIHFLFNLFTEFQVQIETNGSIGKSILICLAKNFKRQTRLQTLIAAGIIIIPRASD